MTTTHESSTMYSAFLSLPTELRCHIYDYLLAEAHAVTVSAAYPTVLGHRIQDRARKQDIPGLPLDLVPLARCYKSASLLSVTKPPEIAIDNVCVGDYAHKSTALGIPAPLALQLTCRLVNDELTDYKRGRKQIEAARAGSCPAKPDIEDSDAVEEEGREGLSLYVTYPYGVLVLKSMYPYLLKQARRVYISGYYKDAEPGSPTSSSTSDEEDSPDLSASFVIAESFGTPPPARTLRRRSTRSIVARASTTTTTTPAPSNPLRPRLRLDAHVAQHTRPMPRNILSLLPYCDSTATLAPAALAHLIRTVLPPTPTQLTHLSARIIYPGETSYGSVWSSDNSPVTRILRNICGGHITLKVKRGALATGLRLTARPKPDARIVSTSWEHWSAAEARRGGAVYPKDLDAFLRGEETGT